MKAFHRPIPLPPLALILAPILALSAACRAPQPQLAPFPEAPRPPLVEEDLKPIERAQVAILDLKDEISQDKKTVAVSGTLVNRGARATQQRIIVHVQALDAEGKVLVETQTLATPEAIAPGNTGRFKVDLQNLPAIQDYQVEVLYKP